jgi:MFS family permease
VSQYIQMACAFLVAILFFTHLVRIWHILALSFVVGLGQSFGGPAYSALLPALVRAEDLSNAIALNSIQFNLARIIGPTIGGVAYTVFGATWYFALNGLSFIAVVFSLYMIRVKFVPPKSHEPILRSMKEGIRFIRNREGMEPLVVLAFCTTLLGFPLTGFLPVFVQNIFKKGPEDVHVVARLFRCRIGVRWIDRGRHRKAAASRARRAADSDCPGDHHHRVCAFELASALRHSDVRGRRSDYGLGIAYGFRWCS